MNRNKLVAAVESALFPVDDPGSWLISEYVADGGVEIPGTGYRIAIVEPDPQSDVGHLMDAAGELLELNVNDEVLSSVRRAINGISAAQLYRIVTPEAQS